MTINKDLIEILACPSCHSSVRDEGNWIVCQGTSCGLKFPVRNGIPVMLLDEAQKA